jgi:hypothetical protein
MEEQQTTSETSSEKRLPSSTEGSQAVPSENSPMLSEEPSESQQSPPTAELQLANMEPHFHPHLHHAKKWKDYLFEFLMLFLAVTAGFFVENQREHYIENKRAAQFSKQLLADLRLDSVFFENRKRDLQYKQKGHDSLLYLLTKKANASNKEILETLFPISFAYDLPVTTTTYSQMKASGSLRYIKNEELTASLQNYYDVLLPRCLKLTEASIEYFNQYINPYYLKHIRIQDYDSFNDSLINKQAEIMNRNSQTDQELANIMGGFRSLLKIQATTMNDPALEKIKETTVLLKNEYHLK